MNQIRSVETAQLVSDQQAIKLIETIYPGVPLLSEPYIRLLATTLLLPGNPVQQMELGSLPHELQNKIITGNEAIQLIPAGSQVFMGGTEEGTPPTLARLLTTTAIPESTVHFLHPRPGFGELFTKRVTGSPTFFPYFGGVELRPYVRSGEMKLDDRSLGVIGQGMVEGDEDFDVVIIRTTKPFMREQYDNSGRPIGIGHYSALMASELATAAYVRAVERKQQGEKVTIIIEIDPRDFNKNDSPVFVPNGSVAVDLDFADAIVVTETQDCAAPPHVSGKPLNAEKQAIIATIGPSTVNEILRDGSKGRTIQGGVGELVNAALIGLVDHLQDTRLATEAGLAVHALLFSRRGVLANGPQAMGFSHAAEIAALFREGSGDTTGPHPIQLSNAIVNNTRQILNHVGPGFVAINTSNTVGVNRMTGRVSIYSTHLSDNEIITAQGGVADFLEAASIIGRAIIPIESTAVISSQAFESLVRGNGGKAPLHRDLGGGKIAVSKVIVGKTHHPTASIAGNISIVTEHGVARMSNGATSTACTQALINVSHPMFREELTRNLEAN